MSLKNNKISKIQDYTFFALQIKEINLENNNLSEINYITFVYDLSNYIRLEILNLKKNPIKYIDPEFIKSYVFANLIEFYLDINNSMKISYIENNKLIKTINGSLFEKMPNLKSIQLNSNQIESIEINTFNNLKYLQKLS